MGLFDGLIGYWPFDEADGNTVFDRSGNGSNGTLVGASRADGVYGSAIFLSGNSNSHVSIAPSSILNSITSQLTVTAWAFPTSPVSGFKVIVSRQIGNLLHPDQFYLGFGPDNGTMHYKWHLGTDNNGTHLEGDIYAGTPAHNRWIHLAGVYTGQTMILYVDGAAIDQASISGNIRVDANPITIGAEENSAVPQNVDGEFEGFIDEVRIYNRALLASEVQAIYQMEN